MFTTTSHRVSTLNSCIQPAWHQEMRYDWKIIQWVARWYPWEKQNQRSGGLITEVHNYPLAVLAQVQEQIHPPKSERDIPGITCAKVRQIACKSHNISCAICQRSPRHQQLWINRVRGNPLTHRGIECLGAQPGLVFQCIAKSWCLERVFCFFCHWCCVKPAKFMGAPFPELDNSRFS